MSETTPSLTEDDILALASPQSFERGVSYFRGGALFNTRCVGNELRGLCQGSDYAPYRVSARLGPDGVEEAYCSCPYDWGGICKHIVALLLARINTPGAFQAVAPTDERLLAKSKEELIALVQEMLKREPDLERLLDLPLHPDPETPLDLDAFRRQISLLLLSEFPDPMELAFEIDAIVETADRFAAEGNGTAAGAIYHLVLSEIISTYDQLYDEDREIALVLQRCAEGLERCLTEDTPDPPTRQTWFDTLLEAEFMDIQIGGIDLAYPARDTLIEHATEEEWNRIEERVREQLHSMRDSYSRWGRESLVTLLAQRLMRTGREEKVSDLIFDLGTAKQRAFELVRLGRFDDAIAMANEHFIDYPGLVLQFADALVETGEIKQAVAYITTQAETSPHPSYLSWLALSAEKQQDPVTAFKWRLSLFDENPGLENYVKLREMAQQLGRWQSLRRDLIQELEAEGQWDLLIRIALADGEVGRAIELLPRQRWPLFDLQVAEAAEASHPEAAVEIYCGRIEQLIEARGRGNYRQAAALLQRVQKLYDQQNARSEWDRYLTELRVQNTRLPALLDELEKAGLI